MTTDSPRDQVLVVPDWAIDPPPTQRNAILRAFRGGQAIGALPIGTSKFYRLGRESDLCDYVLQHPSTSRVHACIVHGPEGAVYVVDLGSRHGTIVQGQKLQPWVYHLLHEGDIFSFGLSPEAFALEGVDPAGRSSAEAKYKALYPETRAQKQSYSYDPHVGTLRSRPGFGSTARQRTVEQNVKSLKGKLSQLTKSFTKAGKVDPIVDQLLYEVKETRNLSHERGLNMWISTVRRLRQHDLEVLIDHLVRLVKGNTMTLRGGAEVMRTTLIAVESLLDNGLGIDILKKHQEDFKFLLDPRSNVRYVSEAQRVYGKLVPGNGQYAYNDVGGPSLCGLQEQTDVFRNPHSLARSGSGVPLKARRSQEIRMSARSHNQVIASGGRSASTSSLDSLASPAVMEFRPSHSSGRSSQGDSEGGTVSVRTSLSSHDPREEQTASAFDFISPTVDASESPAAIVSDAPEVVDAVWTPSLSPDYSTAIEREMELKDSVHLDPAEFERIWVQTPVMKEVTLMLSSFENEAELEDRLGKTRIMILASGKMEDYVKYFYNPASR